MKTVLIVDDNTESLYFLETLLKGNGYGVMTATNGSEALESAIKTSPDLIISDILMPVMDGFTLCRRWKENEQLKHIPFVFYTATYTEPKDEKFALSLGADGFILKPQEPEIFINILTEMFDKNMMKYSSVKPLGEEMEFFRQYNGILFNKLEKKTLDLKIANQKLKAKEEALEKNEQFLDSIIENIPNMLFVKEAETLRFVRFNRAGEELLGINRRDLIGKNDYDFFHENQADFFTNKDREVIENRKLVDIPEEFIQTKLLGERILHTKKIPIIERGGEARYLLGISEDITERKKKEEELRIAHQRLFDIIEFLPDATFVIDHDKKVVAWNRACEEMTGVRKEDIIGQGDYYYSIPFYGERRPILIDYVITDFNKLSQNYKSITRSGNVLYAESFVPKVFNGKGAFLSGNASPLFDKDGNTVGAIESIRDISTIKQLETQLHQSRKMEAIGTLAGGIAHDFNNILTTIIGYGSLLQMDMDNEDPRKQYLDQIFTSSQKAANLTQSLLAFSRKQVIELKPNRVNTLIKGIEKLLRRLITEDIEFNLFLADPDVTIMADITQIDQILMNLAANARDAMPKGGKLKISVEEVGLDGEFIQTHGYGEPGNYALISVIDTGCGMDETTREKIFEPFFTTKEVGRGTGLGLSIVYGIVKQHNGYINVYSEPDRGTVFKIYLPAVKMQTEELRQTQNEMPGGNETILVAEDNNELRGLTKEVLTRKGYTVYEAIDGEDAINRFIEHKNTIDLLILDVVMPRKNGKEAYEEIRTIRPDIKALFTSGYTGDTVIDKGIQDDSVDFISKPLSPNNLLLKVREILGS